MDDSVIKVLRRNGSWTESKSTNNSKKSKKDSSKKSNESFSLDKNFGILAEEIKKRMISKKKNEKSKDFHENKKSSITLNAKRELLPLLKNIETLTYQRDNYLNKINLIDEELDKVKSKIVLIKDSYEKNISQLKNNINFFEQSITLIENIKGEE